MIDETYSYLIAGHLEGSLNSREKKQLRALLKEGEIDPVELKKMEEAWQQLGNLRVPDIRPDNKMHERFYAMLEEEKITELKTQWVNRVRKGFEQHKVVFAAALFLAGILFGSLISPFGSYDDKIDLLTSEVHQMREMMMMSLLENDSPAERLRAVNISNEIPASGDRVAEALLNTLNNDSNVNVRIAAVDALIGHAGSPAVRSRMIESITRQESPLVQIALADAMIAMQERKSVDQFKKLLEQDDMHYNVRSKIENTIIALNE